MLGCGEHSSSALDSGIRAQGRDGDPAGRRRQELCGARLELNSHMLLTKPLCDGDADGRRRQELCGARPSY
jgi:hypothetical protein